MTDPRAGGLPRAVSMGYLTNHLARLFARALHHHIAPHGVVPGQMAQMLALYERDGVTQQELCEIVRIEQPTMAATLQRMERDGLITRRRDPDDRRRSIIELTDHARALEPVLAAAGREVNELALEGLDDDDRRQFIELCTRVIDNLERAIDEGL